MVGRLQGEEWKFIQKYLKKNIQKCRSQLSGSFRRTPVHCAKWLRNSRSKRLISQLCKNLPSTWSDLLAMAITPSFQLQIVHRLKHWIVDFLSFERHIACINWTSESAPKVAEMTVIKNASCWFLFASPPCIPDLLMAKDFKASVLHGF